MPIQSIKRFGIEQAAQKKNAPSSFTLSISLGLEKCVPPLSRFLVDWRVSSALVKRRLRFPTFRARHTTSRNSCENRGVSGVDVFLLSCVFFSGAQAFVVIFMSWRILHGCVVNSSLEKGQRFN